MTKTKAAFLEGRFFPSQSELLEYFLNYSDWLDKNRPSYKSNFCFEHANRLNMSLNQSWACCSCWISAYWMLRL